MTIAASSAVATAMAARAQSRAHFSRSGHHDFARRRISARSAVNFERGSTCWQPAARACAAKSVCTWERNATTGALARRAQLRERFERPLPGVQVHQHERRGLRGRGLHQGVAARNHAKRHANVPGRFHHLRLKEKIVHQRQHVRHDVFSCGLR